MNVQHNRILKIEYIQLLLFHSLIVYILQLVQ